MLVDLFLFVGVRKIAITWPRASVEIHAIPIKATMSGQRLAHFFRNSVQSRNWMTVGVPSGIEIFRDFPKMKWS